MFSTLLLIVCASLFSAASLAADSPAVTNVASLSDLRAYRDALAERVAAQSTAPTEPAQPSTVSEPASPTELRALMLSQLSRLHDFVQQDVPIQIDQRLARIESLKQALLQPTSDPESLFSRLVQLLSQEAELGQQMAVFSQSITHSDQRQHLADVMHLGRVSVVARDTAAAHYWHWQALERRWLLIAPSQHAQLAEAFAVARGEAPVSLLQLPVAVPVLEAPAP